MCLSFPSNLRTVGAVTNTELYILRSNLYLLKIQISHRLERQLSAY